jgi:hypothetical protein
MEIKGMKVNKTGVVASTFLLGIALGAIASEVAYNGLHIFEPGDRIYASEVNANFDYLLRKIELLESKINPPSEDELIGEIIGSWNCGIDQSLIFDASGTFNQIGMYLGNGRKYSWLKFDDDTVSLTGVMGSHNVDLYFVSNDEVTILDYDGDSHQCTRV